MSDFLQSFVTDFLIWTRTGRFFLCLLMLIFGTLAIYDGYTLFGAILMVLGALSFAGWMGWIFPIRDKAKE